MKKDRAKAAATNAALPCAKGHPNVQASLAAALSSSVGSTICRKFYFVCTCSSPIASRLSRDEPNVGRFYSPASTRKSSRKCLNRSVAQEHLVTGRKIVGLCTLSYRQYHAVLKVHVDAMVLSRELDVRGIGVRSYRDLVHADDAGSSTCGYSTDTTFREHQVRRPRPTLERSFHNPPLR